MQIVDNNTGNILGAATKVLLVEEGGVLKAYGKDHLDKDDWKKELKVRTSPVAIYVDVGV